MQLEALASGPELHPLVKVENGVVLNTYKMQLELSAVACACVYYSVSIIILMFSIQPSLALPSLLLQVVELATWSLTQIPVTAMEQ